MDTPAVILFAQTPWQPSSQPLVSGLDMARTAWHNQASCRGMSLDEFYGTGNRRRSVKDICRNCPVRINCVEEALERNYPDGVWGGLSGHERRKLKEGKPTRWTRVLLSKEMIEKWKGRTEDGSVDEQDDVVLTAISSESTETASSTPEDIDFGVETAA